MQNRIDYANGERTLLYYTQFHHLMHGDEVMHFYASALATAVAGGILFLTYQSICPYVSSNPVNISQKHLSSLGTNVPLGPTMN